eukprot:TRINITY_DN29862_c0_g1_i1.p1 TRINITY_DN29862_c0_g1~~TRINITY_DN29862_c0_g1_i1.p1  ORF type:complete len:146 (-),score=27.08 TRINITY_DN29862_c0_g1_i1:61-498(-)
MSAIQSQVVKDSLDSKIEGFNAVFTGEELQRAHAALGGIRTVQEVSPAKGGCEDEGDEPLSVSDWKFSTDQIPDLSTIDHRIRELTFALRKCQRTIDVEGPTPDLYYNCGLILQELAGRVGGAGGLADKEHYWRRRAVNIKMLLG